MKIAAPFAQPAGFFAAPLMMLTAAAIVLPMTAALAQDAGAPSLSEYDNVPPGLLLSPEQRLDHAANVVPTAPVKTNATAGLVAPDEVAAPVVDPQVPTHSLSVLDQKPVQDTTEQRIVGMPQIEAAYARGEYSDIVRPLEALVSQNDPQAILLLGVMLDAGQGVTANAQRATELFARAADMGLPQAQHRLALQYYQGRGVAKDSLKAMMWLHIAAVTYKEGPQKQRAIGDRNNLDAALSRRDRETAMFMARDWMTKKGIVHLLDEEQKTQPAVTAPVQQQQPAPAQPVQPQPVPAQ